MRPNIKACKQCGSPFTPGTKYTYLCPACHARAKAGGVVLERTCRTCGTAFPGGPRAWYCPDCRRARQAEQSRKHKQKGTARPIGSTDTCVKCGGVYVVNAARQKYCPACAEEAVNETVRAHKRQYAADRAGRNAAYKAEMTGSRHVCIVCGSVYDSDKPTVTCSAACDKIRRQRNQQKADAKRTPRKTNNEGSN